MHITVEPPLLWLIGIMIIAMCVAMIVYPAGLAKKQKEQQAICDEQQLQYAEQIRRSEEYQVRSAALMDRQEAVLAQAEQLLNRLNERFPG